MDNVFEEDLGSEFLNLEGKLKHANCVIYSNKNTPTFIVPVYIWFKLKNVMLMDFEKLNA